VVNRLFMLKIAPKDHEASAGTAKKPIPRMLRRAARTLQRRRHPRSNLKRALRQYPHRFATESLQHRSRELVRIQREGRERGEDIVGFYHSHPDHPARWSQTDLAEAHWFGCSM